MKKTLFHIFISILLVITSLAKPGTAKATGGFSNLSDVINTMGLTQQAQHSVRFTLPSNSEPVSTGDYIQIYLPYFSNITAPTSVTGQYGGGTPQFSATGQFARVTNVTITPGSFFTIEGITANNPNNLAFFQVLVLITEDEEGSLVKNSGSIVASNAVGDISVTASINTPQSTLIVNGYTAPGTFITFTENSAVIGTDVANGVGYFAQVFPGLVVTTHNISLYGVDLDYFATSPIPLTIYTPVAQQTTVSNLILSPTLQISSAQVLQGDDLVASGSAIPNGNITLFTDNPLRTYYATASATGHWNYTINNTASYIPGDYRIYGLVQNGVGGQSLNSNTIGFSIVTSSGSTGSACGDVTHGDLNCDDDINLTDFSILMYYWGTANLAADINTDGFVNLTDFSILMYWWGT